MDDLTLAVAAAKFLDLFGCEFVVVGLFALGLSAFGIAVSGVVGICTQKEMRGINAGPVITRMTHTSVGGNIAMTKTVRQTVCAPRSIPSVGCAVAVRVLWAYPVPAIESVVRRYNIVPFATMPVTEAPALKVPAKAKLPGVKLEYIKVLPGGNINL
jgi:hypothetical protein